MPILTILPFSRRYALAGLLAVLSLSGAAPEAAAEPSASSRWSQGTKSAIRLVSGGAGKDGALKAGIEMTLAPGFKTYWRSPGDSGVPPRFDWSASENAGSITVNWPVPERFGEGQDSSIGYTADVILPVSVRAANPDKPVKLVLKLDYAVCEKICIPAAGEAALVLGTGPTAETARIAAFKAQVPVDSAKFEGKTEIKTFHGASGQIKLLVTMTSSDRRRPSDIFVEGPDAWAFGRPVFKPSPDNQAIAMIEVTDRPKSVTGPIPLVITVSSPDQSTETRLDLDMSPARP